MKTVAVFTIHADDSQDPPQYAIEKTIDDSQMIHIRSCNTCRGRITHEVFGFMIDLMKEVEGPVN